MLQQTQTVRVIPKYTNWLRQFPSWKALSTAPLKKVLLAWQGLGYNRRALALKRTAEIIIKEYKGKFPTDYKDILNLPGIGPYTAGAISAFAFNIPLPIIETNIRTVFIHFFFKDRGNIHDADIMPLIEKTLDQKNPREWYWALMDYGAHLKQTEGNASTRSRHYVRQSPFKGSNREMRSLILKYITAHPERTEDQIIDHVKKDPEQIAVNIAALVREGFISEIQHKTFSTYHIVS